MTDSGQLKCIDFGTAKLLNTDKRTHELFGVSTPTLEELDEEASSRLHRPTFVGTPYYVSPEVLEDQECGASADLWALGKISNFYLLRF